jgi:hypothetical protein
VWIRVVSVGRVSSLDAFALTRSVLHPPQTEVCVLLGRGLPEGLTLGTSLGWVLAVGSFTGWGLDGDACHLPHVYNVVVMGWQPLESVETGLFMRESCRPRSRDLCSAMDFPVHPFLHKAVTLKEHNTCIIGSTFMLRGLEALPCSAIL